MSDVHSDPDHLDATDDVTEVTGASPLAPVLRGYGEGEGSSLPLVACGCYLQIGRLKTEQRAVPPCFHPRHSTHPVLTSSEIRLIAREDNRFEKIDIRWQCHHGERRTCN